MTDTSTEGVGGDAIVDAAIATTQDAQAEPVSTDEPASEPADREKATANRLSRLERRIGQLTAQKYQTAQERDELRTKLSQFEGKPQVSDGRPKEQDFAGKPYSEYLDAVTDWKVEQKFKATAQKTQDESKVVQDQQWKEQRIQHATDNSDQAKATFADYGQVYNDYQDVLGSLPPEIEKVLLEADNPSFAFYALAKDGTLENLATMTPTKAAATIALAEQRALAMRKPSTNAPAPMASAKGVSPGTKGPDNMNGKELLSWLDS